jgi:type II secretory pathway pseudopilin PulG
MKRIINLLALAAAVAVFAVPALAQSQECNDENKGAWYKTFFDNYKGDAAAQKVAYDAAKKYIDTCPDDANDAQRKYMKKFMDLVDANKKKGETGKACEEAIQRKNYVEEMRACKELLATDPDNVDVTTVLGVAGLSEAKVLPESAGYAAKAIQLIEGGKAIKVYSRDQALAYLNWTIAKSKLQNAPTDAITDLLKAAKLESEVKKSPSLYIDLSTAYETGPRAKYSKDYADSLNADKTEKPESKVILENLNRVIDNQIDAMARAAATAPADAKAGIVAELAKLYKYRNKDATDAKVSELVAGVLSKPIPDVPTPVTSVPTPTPAATPAATPANSNGAATTSGGAKTNGASTSTNAAGGNTTNTGNKAPAAGGATAPAASRRPRLNHRRG